MPIELIAGQSTELNAALTSIVAPGELTIKQFFVFTWRIGLEGDGDWEIHCVVRNPTDHAAAGTIHCTGELHRAGGFDVRQIDETQEFVVAARGTHRFMLESRYFPHCQYMDLCWAKIDTSWGESTERQLFYAGYFGPREGEIRVLGVGANYARVRFGHSACTGSSSRSHDWLLRTPPTHTAEHILFEECYSPTSNICALGSYFYAYPLLSNRDYYVGCQNGYVSPSTTFRTL